MKYKDELTNELIETICDDNYYMIKFLDITNDLESMVEDQINKMDDNEFKNTWDEYHDYQSIKDTILDYEEEKLNE